MIALKKFCLDGTIANTEICPDAMIANSVFCLRCNELNSAETILLINKALFTHKTN